MTIQTRSEGDSELPLGYTLRTRVLRIILSQSNWDLVHPPHTQDDTLDSSDSSSFSDHEPDSTLDSSSLSPDLEEEDLYEFGPIDDAEVEELNKEQQDLAAEAIANADQCWPPPMSSLDDLASYRTLTGIFDTKMYKAIQRVLEACSSTLQCLILLLRPRHLMPPSLIFPKLPVLTDLTICIPSYRDRVRRQSRIVHEGDSQGLGMSSFPRLRTMRIKACPYGRYHGPDDWLHSMLLLLPRDSGKREKLTIMINKFDFMSETFVSHPAPRLIPGNYTP